MGIEEIRRLKANAGLPKPKKTYIIPKVSKKKQARNEAEKAAGGNLEKKTLNQWFSDIEEKHWNRGLCMCEECGTGIGREYARTAIAHLLPKKLFKSVSTHPLNYMILCASNGCHEKTHRIDKFEKMRIWPEASRRIKEMIPLLPFDELKHLSSQLMKALEN